MVTISLISFALLALLFDYIILKRHISRPKWLKIAYVFQALTLDIGVLIYLVYSFFTSEVYSDAAIVAATWLILVFLMSFVTKGVFALFSLTELIVSKYTKRKGRGLILCGGLIAGVILSTMIYGATIGRSSIRVEHVTLKFADLPEAFDGFTIAQFSDAHLGNLGSCNPLIENMVRKINELNPDIVVQSGDLVNIHSGELNAKFISQFAQIKAPVYSVLGNHDLGYYIRGNAIPPEKSILDLVAKQEETLGWTLLRNNNTRIYRGGDSIAICGVVYPADNRLGVRNNGYGGSHIVKTFEGIDPAEFSILISHTPALFDSVPISAKPKLTISGHVHAMQAKISIGGWKWSPAKWLFPMWSGLYEDRGHYLYINDGMGYALYPMRIGTRPEITLYELRRR